MKRLQKPITLPVAETNKKYQIIMADPPWQYDFSKDNADKIENHYPTMTLKQICSLNVPSDDNCVLYLWATAPKLLEALEVMKSWGFKYKTHAIWDKQWIGMGYWFRGTHELLLVGTKGKVSPPKPTKRVASVYKERRTEHSKKPRYFRDIITDSFSADWNKLEMFARQKTDGWDAIGYEIDSQDIKKTLENMAK